MGILEKKWDRFLKKFELNGRDKEIIKIYLEPLKRHGKEGLYINYIKINN